MLIPVGTFAPALKLQSATDQCSLTQERGEDDNINHFALMTAEAVFRLLWYLELLLSVLLLGLLASGREDGDTLWEAGGAEGWNSDPEQRVYFYANYEQPPEIPLVWSQG